MQQQAAAATGIFRSILPACMSAVGSGQGMATTSMPTWLKILLVIVTVVGIVLAWRWWKARNQRTTGRQLSLSDRVQRLELIVQQYLLSGGNPYSDIGAGAAAMSHISSLPGQGQAGMINHHGHGSSASSANMLRKIHVDPFDKDRVTMPTSGRFYDANEFHAVGFITLIRTQPGGQADLSVPDGMPGSLPLYGQRVTSESSRVSRWQYTTVFNNAQHNVVRVKSVHPFVVDDCSNGCDEFDPASTPGDILVVVPGLAGGTLWKAKMYSRI